MDHVAIMESSRGLIPKILSGEKTIESRWYRARFAPWNKIQAGEIIYFKDAGQPITARATVECVLQFDHPTKKVLLKLLENFGGNPGICFSDSRAQTLRWATQRPFVILLFLKDARRIKPFKIDKAGFGNACAWLTMSDFEQRKQPVYEND